VPATDTPSAECVARTDPQLQDFIRTAVAHPAVSAFLKEYLFGAIRAGDDPGPEIADAIRLAIDDALTSASAADWEKVGGELIAWARQFETARPATMSSCVGAQPVLQRKRPVRVDSNAILAWLREQGSATLLEIARHFDISTASAQGKADGLARAGRLDVTPGSVRLRTPRSYSVPPPSARDHGDTADDELPPAPRKLLAAAS
jgi:hypothetical protein